MDYDLRRRIETFADGNCSSEAFIQELATHCADAPDFIWDVLALIDQYHRRGKISAEFQRSVRELIERPALTHERPPASVRHADALAGSVVALTRVSSVRAEARIAQELSPPATSRQAYPPTKLAMALSSASSVGAGPGSAQEPTPPASSRLANPPAEPAVTLSRVSGVRADSHIVHEPTPLASSRQANPPTEPPVTLSTVSSVRADPHTVHEPMPLASSRQANPTAEPAVTLSNVSSVHAGPHTVHEPALRVTQPGAPSTEALDHSSPSAHAPVWARDGQIIVPVLQEYRLPAREVQAPVLNHRMVLPAQTAGDAWPVSLSELKVQVRLNRSADSEAALDVPGLRRTSRSRSAQLALLAVLVCCVSASSAIYQLAIRPVAASAPVSTPPLQPPNISLSTDSYIVYPGAKSALIEVDRTGDSSEDLSFVWWTRESGAKSGHDYRGSRPKTEHLPAGANSMQWSIPIYANAERRHTELFYVFIGSPGGGAGIGATTRATVFIMSPH